MEVLFIYKTFDFKTRPNLNVENKDIEAITLEIVSNKSRTSRSIYCCIETEPLETFLHRVFPQTKGCSKTLLIARNFNLNLPDFDINRKVYIFLNLIYQNGMIQTMNKSIKHILRNYFTNIVFKTTDIFDHLPIRYLSQNTILQKSKDIYTFIYRKIYI